MNAYHTVRQIWRNLRSAPNCGALVFAALLPFSGCKPKEAATQSSEPNISSNSIVIPTNSPQFSAIAVEPVESHQSTVVPLAGRLTWNEEVTVRVFTPFAGI